MTMHHIHLDAVGGIAGDMFAARGAAAWTACDLPHCEGLIQPPEFGLIPIPVIFDSMGDSEGRRDVIQHGDLGEDPHAESSRPAM